MTLCDTKRKKKHYIENTSRTLKGNLENKEKTENLKFNM